MMNTLPSSLMHTNLRTSTTKPTLLFPIKTNPLFNYPKNGSFSPVSMTIKNAERLTRQKLKHPTKRNQPNKPLNSELLMSKSQNEASRVGSNLVLVGVVTVGLALFVMGFDDDQKALAFGPEGPLVEEFWDNMRRYALYALTVSTGFAYTIFQPILELLRNPISAILVIAIFGGSIYIVTQVLSAMVGVSNFSYDYSY